MSSWSAPGKLFLFGEYAVLGGAWSVVAAVDRRVTATFEPGESYRVQGAAASSELPDRVLSAAGADFDASYVSCDVRPFFETNRKLGLGSSAASSVAIAALATDGEGGPDRLFEVAGGAHRAFQGGRGSHADVAAAVYGGLLGYRLSDPVPPFRRISADPIDGERRVAFAHIASLQWPNGVRARAKWLGEPASSTELIGRVEPGVQAGDAATLSALESAGAASARAIAAIQDKDGDGLLRAVSAAHDAMDELGAATGAPIVVPDARAAFRTAHAVGIAAKMSGAGGGDFALFVGFDDADWQQLESQHPGLWLDLSFDVTGASASA